MDSRRAFRTFSPLLCFSFDHGFRVTERITSSSSSSTSITHPPPPPPPPPPPCAACLLHKSEDADAKTNILPVAWCIGLQPCSIAPVSQRSARDILAPTSRYLFPRTGSSSDMPYCHFPSHDIPGSARPAKKSPAWQWCSRPHAMAVAGFKLSVLYSDDGYKHPPYVRRLPHSVFVTVCAGTMLQPVAGDEAQFCV